MTDEREHHQEINELVSRIAAALEIEPDEAVRAIEAGEITVAMTADEDGRRCLDVTHGDNAVRLY